jgi:hypothetical protein
MARTRNADRKRYWREIIERQQASGQSIVGFCSQEALRYSLFAVDKKPKSYQPGVPDEELRKTRPNWRKFRSLRCPKVEFNFHRKCGVPVRAKAIVKTPDALFLAGPEDVLDEEEAYKNPQDEKSQRLLQKEKELIDSRDGGKLLAVSARDGSTQQMIDLQSQPVWDGMAAAYGRLFMCYRKGSVVALGAGKACKRSCN